MSMRKPFLNKLILKGAPRLKRQKEKLSVPKDKKKDIVYPISISFAEQVSWVINCV